VHRIASGRQPAGSTTASADAPAVSFVDGHVEAVLDPPGEVAEVVVDGRTVRATWVFDSVTRTAPSTVDGWLAFTGDEVRTDEPRFDPTTPVLMDFRTPPGTGVRFVYVLPTDEHRALVELTEFVPRHATPPSEAERRDALGAYLREMVGGRPEVLRTESAVLPLSAYPGPRRHGRVLDIGVHGGLVKASTGYAYQRIQRDSRSIARSLVEHGHPFDVPPPRPRHRLLDALLLDVLDHDPAQLELAFARLFGRHPAERVLRFLDEDTAPGDELRLIATLPPMPYLRALTRRRR
jgi:lycopene beta-cyclase